MNHLLFVRQEHRRRLLINDCWTQMLSPLKQRTFLKPFKLKAVFHIVRLPNP